MLLEAAVCAAATTIFQVLAFNDVVVGGRRGAA